MVGRPYEFFRIVRVGELSWSELLDRKRCTEYEMKELCRSYAAAEPGVSFRALDEWLNEPAYQCRVDPRSGRLWASGFRRTFRGLA